MGEGGAGGTVGVEQPIPLRDAKDRTGILFREPRQPSQTIIPLPNFHLSLARLGDVATDTQTIVDLLLICFRLLGSSQLEPQPANPLPQFHEFGDQLFFGLVLVVHDAPAVWLPLLAAPLLGFYENLAGYGRSQMPLVCPWWTDWQATGTVTLGGKTHPRRPGTVPWTSSQPGCQIQWKLTRGTN